MTHPKALLDYSAGKAGNEITVTNPILLGTCPLQLRLSTQAQVFCVPCPYYNPDDAPKVLGNRYSSKIRVLDEGLSPITFYKHVCLHSSSSSNHRPTVLCQQHRPCGRTTMTTTSPRGRQASNYLQNFDIMVTRRIWTTPVLVASRFLY